MAADRAGAIAAAMKVHQDPRGIAAGNYRPFSRHAAEVDRLELYVLGHRPDRADLVEPPAALRPSERPRLGAEQRAHGIDFTLTHGRQFGQ